MASNNGGMSSNSTPRSLQVLAGGDVSAAVLTATIDRFTQQFQLLGVITPLGSRKRQHEAAGCDRRKKIPNHLRRMVRVASSRAFPAIAGQLGQAGQGVEAAEVSLGLPTLVSVAGRCSEAEGKRKSWRYKRHAQQAHRTTWEKWRDGANHAAANPMEPKLKVPANSAPVDPATAAPAAGPQQRWNRKQPADANERCVAWEWSTRP